MITKWNNGRVIIFLLMMLLMVNSTMDSTLYSHYLVKQTLNMGVMVFFLMMLVKKAYRLVLGHFR
ncbi:hypothetical protein QTG56_02380 [Rossellomorea sp. AcN35-11]|nr:hypothetical protein [Rossellomorea aquimaris]WJV30029.1 hypothetical protein QTG56_02380 [Rossellomorea sp. AcN35-11]